MRLVGFDVGRQTALLAQLAEWVRPPSGLEQVGADLGVVGQRLRDLAERLGVVRDHRAGADRRDELLRGWVWCR